MAETLSKWVVWCFGDTTKGVKYYAGVGWLSPNIEDAMTFRTPEVAQWAADIATEKDKDGKTYHVERVAI